MLFIYYVNLPERGDEKHSCYVQFELYISSFGWDGRKDIQITMKFSKVRRMTNGPMDPSGNFSKWLTFICNKKRDFIT
jgi:hypothetical protein